MPVIKKVIKSRYRKPDVARTVFLCCDIQERFRSLILGMPTVVHSAKTLIFGGKLLGCPLVVTEQYPQALGHTIPELDVSHAAVVAEKFKFSMITPEVEPFVEKSNCDNAVLFGIESHVCVLQTALELLSKGINVYVVSDAVSSQRAYDRKMAFKRLRQGGAIVTTTESILFELFGDAKHPKFKEFSQFIKGANSERPACEW